MEGGGALCEDTSVTHPVESDDPDNKDRLDVPRTSDSDDADSAVCSEASMPRDINLSGPQPHNNGKDDADSGVCSEDSIHRGINFSGSQPHNDNDAHSESSKATQETKCLRSDQSKPTGPSFCDKALIHQLEVKKLCDRACGICLGNVHHAVKHCKTCSVSYCETHVADHYKSQAFSAHELVNESPATEHPLQWNNSDPNLNLPELRVMMLGKTGAGKSASGNTILGRELFKSEASALPVTKSCDSQSGVVEGRNITVIDTPAIRTKKAAWLLEKVDAGPHVFLLVIPLGRFIEEDGNEVKWTQGNIGDDVLKFTIILFTGGDQLKGKPLEDFLSESPKLQTLLHRVEGRYHVFNNSLPTDHEQVKGLIKKIDKVLMKKLGYAYTHEEQKRLREKQAHKSGIWMLLIILSVLTALALRFHHLL